VKSQPTQGRTNTAAQVQNLPHVNGFTRESNVHYQIETLADLGQVPQSSIAPHMMSHLATDHELSGAAR
jgi:hypothetical protein